MDFRVLKISATLGLLMSLSYSATAATSLTIAAFNDYLFNGVSQTNKDPALQLGLDWRNNTGFYIGAWGSNVDFDGTDIEADASAGYTHAISRDLSYDVGLSQYTYHGNSHSHEANYAEAHAVLNYKNTSLTAWYAWDYFGTGARHYIIKLAHTIALTDNTSLDLAVDRSASLDTNKWAWDGDNAYVHWQVGGNYLLRGFQLSLALHGTTLKHSGDTRLLFGVAKPFNF